jgi:hypothetical protein
MGTRSWKSSQAALQLKRFAHYCSDACRQWLTAVTVLQKTEAFFEVALPRYGPPTPTHMEEARLIRKSPLTMNA